MRNLNPDALAKIAQHFGNEPITIIDVQWIKDSGTISYADRTVGSVQGKILEVSDLDAVVNISNNSDSQEITVTLDDTDGTIKAIMDRNDIHKRNVWVYQYFEGLDYSDRFLLFDGKINSPIVWDEGKRILTFTVLAQLEDKEIGFSPEEGEFPNMLQSFVGEPWPMVFGTVAHSKTIHVTRSLRGTTVEGLGFPDFTVGPRLVALLSICEYSTRWLAHTIASSTHCQQYIALKTASHGQHATARDSINIFNGERFPRGDITLDIGGALVAGHFGSGDSRRFYIDGGSANVAQHPSTYEYLWNAGNIAQQYRARKSGLIFPRRDSQKGSRQIPYASGYIIGGAHGMHAIFIPTGEVVGDSASYVYKKPGSTVRLATTEPQAYVVSITPGEVLRVVAWAQKDGQRFIQDVPTNWYTIREEVFGSITATILTIDDTLSKREELGFDDDIFVTYKSTIGPNTVDILEYLIDLYTDFEIDPTSFAHVKSRLQNYPSHFTIYDRKNILDVLQEITWQARCAIYLRNNVFYLLYLPELPAVQDTITANDTLLESLKLDHTPTEDLVTKMVCTWTANGLQDEPFTTILRHNVAKYGTQEATFDYYIYDFVDAVVKSATFWLIRYANTWKKVEFSTPLTKLNLETFDSVSFDVAGFLADAPVDVLVEEATYNSEDNTISFVCWSPVKAGTMEVYDFAHPADLPVTDTFPTDYEIKQGFDGGDGPGKESICLMILPEGNGLFYPKGWEDDEEEENEMEEEDPYDEEEEKKSDKGTPKPADTGDRHPGEKVIRPGETMEPSAPGPDSPDANGAGIPQPDGYGGPNSGFPENPDAGPDDGTGDPGSGSPAQDALDDLPSCDDSEFANCPKVKITWLNGVDKVSQPQGGGPCIQTRVPPERGVCTSTGGFQDEIIVFNTNQEAQDFATAMKAKITQKGLTGDTIPYFANFIAGVDDCQDTGKSDGATGYCNNNPSGYGAGAFLEGVPSNGFGA